jgi:hypothetical protein
MIAEPPEGLGFERARFVVPLVSAELVAEIGNGGLEVSGAEVRAGPFAPCGVRPRIAIDRAIRRRECPVGVTLHGEEPRGHPLRSRVVGRRVGGTPRPGDRRVGATLDRVEPRSCERELGVVAGRHLREDRLRVLDALRRALGLRRDEQQLGAPQQRRAAPRLEGERLVDLREGAAPVRLVLAQGRDLEVRAGRRRIGRIERQRRRRRGCALELRAAREPEHEPDRERGPPPGVESRHAVLPRKRTTIQRSRWRGTGAESGYHAWGG